MSALQLARGRPLAKTSWGAFGPGFISIQASANGPTPPPPSGGNRMGGTGAIRKPPRPTSNR